MSDLDETPLQDMTAAVAAYEAKLLSVLKSAGAGDVSLAECTLLSLAEGAPKSMVQIAAQRGVSKQAVQSQIQSLAKRGYVSVVKDKTDARVRLVSLTVSGGKAVAALRSAHAEVETLVENKLGTQRLKNFRNILGQVTAAVS